MNANLNRLSLPAPRNWVQKKGAKRRCASSANWFGWSCPACGLDSEPVTRPDEASYLAGVHDDVHHGGAPTTYVHTTTTTTTSTQEIGETA